MLKKNLSKSNVSTAFQSWTQYVAEVWDCWTQMKRGSETSPLSTWQRVFSCLFARRGRSSCPRATRVDNARYKTLWNTAAPMSSWQKLCTFLAHGDEIDSNSEQQWCGRRVAGWQCNVLDWLRSRWKMPHLVFPSYLSVSLWAQHGES